MEQPMDFIAVRDFGLKSYHSVLDDMQRFTHARTQGTADQIWYVQHPAVYTRGVSCHDLPWGDGRDLELVDSDRGGQQNGQEKARGEAIFSFMIQRDRFVRLSGFEATWLVYVPLCSK